MSVVWSIGASTLEQLGLEFAGGSFRSGAASEMRLRRVSAFDAAPLYNYGQAITLLRNGSPYFSGKVVTRPSFGSANAEGQEILVRDAWQDLEDTIYLEPWAVGSGTFQFPIAVLGVDNAGEPISTGTQISEAVLMAITAGANLQLGTVPAGLPLWPTEVRNVSVAEVIRISSKLHPDWEPWIDHSQSPPMLSVTPRSMLAATAVNVDGTGDVTDFSITKRDDLKPEAVRLTYTNATIIDGVTYRDGILDKWPEAGPDSGPRVLSAVIELAGGQMQFQKSRIQTRTLPTDQASAKTWLKLKFPHLKDVPDGEFDVTTFDKELFEETEDQPDPINPQATRLAVSDATDLPRELVRGSIEDWMRRKVGKVRITATLKASAGASAATKAAIAKGLPGVTVTATDAVTKIYKGISQWVAPEAAPTGIAQSVYEALSAYQFEGSVSLTLEDVTATRYHGTGLNILGGQGEWATMKAMVHSVSFDIDSGSVSIGFGPAPHLAAEDFLELQRMLRGRTPTWMSQAERTSNELGAENDPGSKGDTVAGYDIPETLLDPSGGESGGRYVLSISDSKLYVSPGGVSHVEITVAEGEDELPPVNVVPVIAELEGTALDAETPPFFDLAGRTDGAVWLIMQASPCEDGSTDAPPRVELTAREAEPVAAPGELAVALDKFDLIDGSDGKAFDNLEVLHESDWIQHYMCGGGSSSSEESDDPGSGKDTAIVPAAWTGKNYGYVALYALECKDVRFDDTFIDLPVTGRETRHRIDRRFLRVIEPDTLRVVSVSGDLPYAVGARIEGRDLVVHALADSRRRPTQVNVRFTAIRKGFRNVCFTPKTREEFDANERRLNLDTFRE